VPKKDSLPAWGYDNYKIQGPFADVATLEVNTVVSTLRAGAAMGKEDGMFKPGSEKDLNGPTDGILSKAFSQPKDFAHFYGSMSIDVQLTKAVENWEDFFAAIDKKAVVVAFGSPSPVPELATMLLLGTGLIGLAAFGRRKLFKK
jgi:hypothetical protein